MEVAGVDGVLPLVSGTRRGGSDEVARLKKSKSARSLEGNKSLKVLRSGWIDIHRSLLYIALRISGAEFRGKLSEMATGGN